MLTYTVYKIITYFNMFVIGYVVIMSLINLIQMILYIVYTSTYLRKAKFSDMKKFSESANMIPFSILVPVYNEEHIIPDSIRSLLSLNYRNFEIIVINDGSSDSTFNAIVNAFALNKISYPICSKLHTEEVYGIYYNSEYPRLRLINKKNGGKADALNAGINLSRYPYFGTIDSGSLLGSDALTRIAMAFMEYKYTIAVGGTVQAANGGTIENGKIIDPVLPRKSIARFQVTEYFRVFRVGRVGGSIFNPLLIISGAFVAFQKSFVLDVGGYTTKTFGENMELVLKLHKYMHKQKYKYRISFLPEPICWIWMPETIKNLYTQRRRWHIGLIDSFMGSRDMFLNPRYGVLGMLAMPYYFFFEILGPLVEGLSLIVIPLSYFLGLLAVEHLILFFATTTIFDVFLSVGSLAVAGYTFNKYTKLKDILILSLYSVIENFSYRQMTVFFRLASMFCYGKHKRF